MDLRCLSHFVRVAELGSLAPAADALEVTPSTLSRSIRQLEVELRAHLLVRDGRRMRPTDAGHRLLTHGRLILAQLQHAESDLRAHRGAPVGRIVVGLPMNLAGSLAVPLVRGFGERFPLAEVALVEGLPRHLAEGVVHGRIDLALLHTASRLDGLSFQPLVRESLHLVGPAGDRRKPDDQPVESSALPDYPLILPARGLGLRRTVDEHLADLGLAARVVHQVTGMHAVLALVAAGHGYTLLPSSSMHDSRRRRHYTVSPVRNPDLAMTLSIASSSTRPAGTLGVSHLLSELVAALSLPPAAVA